MATPDALPPQRGAGAGYKVKEVEDPLFSRSQGNTRRPAAGRSGIVTGPNRCAPTVNIRNIRSTSKKAKPSRACLARHPPFVETIRRSVH